MPKRKSLFCCGSVLDGKSVDESYIVADRKVRDEKKDRRFSVADKSSMTVREIRELLCPECQSSEIVRSGKTGGGAQRYRCGKCGHVFVSSEGRNLFSTKLSLKELLSLMRGILSGMTQKQLCVSIGISKKTAILWQQRVFAVSKSWVDGQTLSHHVWIDEVYFPLTASGEEMKRMKKAKMAGLSRLQVCCCIGADDRGHRFVRVVKTGKIDMLSVLCCFSNRIEKGSRLTHDGAKEHRRLIERLKLRRRAYLSTDKSEKAMKAMMAINNYSALLKNSMRKYSGTKTGNLEDRLCFITYRAWILKKFGLMLGSEFLLSKIVKSEKTVFSIRKAKKKHMNVKKLATLFSTI
jgi:predicted Zn finger-like uncharacterized protein